MHKYRYTYLGEGNNRYMPTSVRQKRDDSCIEANCRGSDCIKTFQKKSPANLSRKHPNNRGEQVPRYLKRRSEQPSIGSSETVVEPPANLFPSPESSPSPSLLLPHHSRSIIMFAARRSVNLFQKRAFSASASNVRIPVSHLNSSSPSRRPPRSLFSVLPVVLASLSLCC